MPSDSCRWRAHLHCLCNMYHTLLIVSVFAAAGNSTQASVNGGPPLAAEASWEVLQAAHGRLTAAAAANNGADMLMCINHTTRQTIRQ